MNEKEWMKNHNVPELLRLCLEQMNINDDYSAFTGLNTGVATVQVSYDGNQITMENISVGDVSACEEELENVKNELKKAETEINSQNQKIEELESQIHTPSTEEVIDKPVVAKTSRKRRAI